RAHIIDTIVSSKLIDEGTKILVNPTGRFVVGGPKGDAGVTGRKIIVETFGTGKVPDERILAAVRKHFDLRPGAIIADLNLRRPIYRATASYGHFGRTDLDAPWEDTSRAHVLAVAAGLT